MIVKSLCENRAKAALIITPKPYSAVAQLLKNMITTELLASQHIFSDVQRWARQSLDKVLLSSVFDMDGVWQSLVELDSKDKDSREQQPLYDALNVGKPPSSSSSSSSSKVDVVIEKNQIEDSDDDQLSPQAENTASQLETEVESTLQEAEKASPDIIVLTDFSTFLTSLFTQRERSAAHSSLLLLKSHLHFLARSLSSNPLILIVNSTTAEPAPRGAEAHLSGLVHPSSGASKSDNGLRSIFSSLHYSMERYNDPGPFRRVRPSFGLIFSQLLDLHILCTAISEAHGPDGTERNTLKTAGRNKSGVTSTTSLVEILSDDVGTWSVSCSPGAKSREQRWGICRLVTSSKAG